MQFAIKPKMTVLLLNGLVLALALKTASGQVNTTAGNSGHVHNNVHNDVKAVRLESHAAVKSAPRDGPVIVIHNLCGSHAANVQVRSRKPNSRPCETPISRLEFESLAAAVDSSLPQSQRLALATEYVKLLVLSQEAERR